MDDQYWRDIAIKLLGWGIATCFIVIGWTINSGELFYFCSNQQSVIIRTYFINIIVLLVGILWIVALNYINSKIPAEQPHVNKKLMKWVAMAFLLLTTSIVFMSSIYNPVDKSCITLNNTLHRTSSLSFLRL